MAGAFTVAAALTVVLLVPGPSGASEQHGLQTVQVRLGPDGTIDAVATASVVQDASGAVVETRRDLVPADAARDLPVRVETSWWHDGAAGTDLSDLDGRAGRFVVQVGVHDLTAEVTEVGFETGGSRYRQQALVGVPLTVVAGAQVGAGDRVVQVAAPEDVDARSTDGVLVETPDAGRSVQWAAFLAPPMLSPTATFTLVVDSPDFQVPAFDLTVQPGLVTDPSVGALLDRAYGSDGYAARLEGSTIDLVHRVNRSLGEALEFVDDVHEALGRDVADLGERTYQNLGSNAEAVVDQLHRTVDDLEVVRRDAGAGIDRVGAETRSGVQGLSRELVDLLGSPGALPETTPTVVQGCSVTMPTLAPGAPRTVSATVGLADAQLRTIASLFGTGYGAPSDNCRTALHAMVRDTVGDPADLEDPAQAAACRSTPADRRTVACTLAVTRESLVRELSGLADRHGGVRDVVEDLAVPVLGGALAGADGLATALTDLRAGIAESLDGARSTVQDVAAWAERAQRRIGEAREAVAAARSAAAEAAGALGRAGDARDAVRAALTDDEGGLGARLDALEGGLAESVATGEWFLASPYVGALNDLAAGLGGACADDWADALGPASSAAEVGAALALLDEPDCPVAGIAAATADLVHGYDAARTDVVAAGSEVTAARAALDDALDGLDALGQALDDARTVTGGALAVGLDALDDPETGDGALPELAAEVALITALADEGGGLTAARDRLVALDQRVAGIWPDDEHLPVTGTGACPAVPLDLGRMPGPAGQAVVWLANRLLCLEADLERRVEDLERRIEATTAASDAELVRSSARTQDAVDRTRTQVDAFATGIVTEVDAQREAATTASRALLEQSRAQVRDGLDAVLAEYDLAASQVLVELTDAMERSASESASVADVLRTDFADLLADLGSPEPTSRGGLLGKLHGITTQVGATGSTLDAAGTTTTAYGNVRSAELHDLDLRAAQFAAAEERLAGYRPFADVDDDLETVVVFQLRGVR